MTLIQVMVANIAHLSDQLVEEEKRLSNEKLKALQHQINPHFLNNVLQTIKALAVTGSVEEISKISTLLGHMLAYSVYEPYQNVQLGTELQYLKNYIELQNIRYEGRIIYSVSCETGCEKILIPKLTLQPLVENCIEHGYQQSRLVIDIGIEAESDVVCVIINDNGRGIPGEELEELQNRLATGQVYQQKNSVGIINVNNRLKKMFGAAYGIEILSKSHGGTTVIIRIPRGEGDKNESITG